MVKIKGTRREIAKAVEGIDPTYPAEIVLSHLEIGEWHFFVNEIDVCVQIEEDTDV